MSTATAGQLLRRRSSTLIHLHQREARRSFGAWKQGCSRKDPGKSSAALLDTPPLIESPVRFLAYRKYSASTSPSQGPIQAAKGSEGGNILKVGTVGAAIVLLSTAAWYVTKDKLPQVPSVALPRVLYGEAHVQDSPSSHQNAEHTEVNSAAGEHESQDSTGTVQAPAEDSELRTENTLQSTLLNSSIAENEIQHDQIDSNADLHQNVGTEEKPVTVVDIDARQDEADQAKDESVDNMQIVVAVPDTTDPVEEQTWDPVQELNKVLGAEYVSAHDLPSDVPYLIRRGHEDNLKRYSLKNGGDMVELPPQDTFREEVLLATKDQHFDDNVKSSKVNVVDVEVLVSAIHTAEQMQAETDSRIFQKQQKKVQDEHMQEVRDYHTRIRLYSEDISRLEEELSKIKEMSDTKFKLLQESSEESLQKQLQSNDKALKREKEKLQLLARTQVTAAIAKEKADHLQDTSDLRLQLEALRVAFYTRSEEARVSHTAHKLAMGTFALENASEAGYPVFKEAILLLAAAGGIGGDPLIDAALASIPMDSFMNGTGNQAQLRQQFARLKGPLRELVLLRAGGGGFLAHLLARIAANLKVSEHGFNDSGGGIEVVLGTVEGLLVEGKLMEAAAVLEKGTEGTQAQELAVDWAKQARNRAVLEQALSMVQAHVISVSAGLA